MYDTGFSRVSKFFNNMVNIRDNLERISLITGYAATALAGVTELLPEKEYFSNAPIWGVASAAFNEEKPAMQIYNPSRLEARSLRNETSKKLD